MGYYRAYARWTATGGLGHYERERRPPPPWMKLKDMVEYVEGLENPSDFPNIAKWLVKNGYSDSEIAKIIGGNGLRLLRATW